MTTAREQPEKAGAARLTRAARPRLPDLLARYFRAGSHQEGLTGRIHAATDAFALQAGWTVTRATGRFGFGGRTYRDPRFVRLHPDRIAKGPD